MRGDVVSVVGRLGTVAGCARFVVCGALVTGVLVTGVLVGGVVELVVVVDVVLAGAVVEEVDGAVERTGIGPVAVVLLGDVV